MSSFTKFNAELKVQFHDGASKLLGKDHWITTEGFTYYLGSKGSDRWVQVPIGYLTDGASVPRLFWSILPPWGKYGQAAVLHDYLCDYGRIIDKGIPININREEVDNIFYEAMEVLQVPKLTISLMKKGVNLYRKVFKPTTPNISQEKRELERQILNNFHKTNKLEI